MNQAEFAKHCGVSKAAVTKWKAKGLLVFNGNKIDVAATEELHRKHRNTVSHRGVNLEKNVVNSVNEETKKKDVTRSEAKRNSVKSEKPGGNPSDRISRSSGNPDGQRKKRPIVINNEKRDPDSDFDGVMDENLMTFNDARTMKENYRALKEQLEYDTQAGTVLPFDDIIVAIREEYSRMRTRLIAIAPEHGPRLRMLASTSTDNEFVQEIQEVLYEAMEELSLDTTERREGGRQ